MVRAPTGPPMALLCHLLPGPAAAGRFVGHVELIHTGERIAVADVAGLLALLIRWADEAPD
ncbi:MAG: hypothetical protein QOD96_7471 [Pseudonocardiales bacterium]|nr:hypothetical protein [Pseudonocardiales bacterium]